jgi:hypothetical protein
MILGSENKGIVEGLFLEPVPVGPGVYRRIGIFHEPEWMTYWGDYEWTHRLVDDLPKGIAKQRITLVLSYNDRHFKFFFLSLSRFAIAHFG